MTCSECHFGKGHCQCWEHPHLGWVSRTWSLIQPIETEEDAYRDDPQLQAIQRLREGLAQAGSPPSLTWGMVNVSSQANAQARYSGYSTMANIFGGMLGGLGAIQGCPRHWGPCDCHLRRKL